MIFAPTYTRHERSVVGRLHLLGLDGDRTLAPRHEFRPSSATDWSPRQPDGTGDCSGLALAGC